MRALLARVLCMGTCVTCVALPAGVRGDRAFADQKERPKVETVFFNGAIHTLDAAKPFVEAISTAGGRILETGSSAEILTRLAPGVRKVDLRGRTVIPALTDAHAHFMGYAMNSTKLDLTVTSSLDGILEMVSGKLVSAQPGSWILGRGWDQNDWPDARYPEKAALDRIAPDNPVYLVRICGHAAFVNSAALRLAGITRDTADPPGGRILKDAGGEPSGVLLDEAMQLVDRVIPSRTRAEKKELLAAAARNCLAAGLVGVHEMGMTAEAVSVYREIYEAGEFPFRITGYLLPDDPGNALFLDTGPLEGEGDGLFRIIGAKFFADGSLGARSAALLADYSDDPLNRGILMKSPEELYGEIRPWREKGFQIAVHAIGDAAVREVLDVYERLGAAGLSVDARNRVEHAQVISPRDLPRFAALGAIASMQFKHCTSDMPWAQARLGPERIVGAYAWRSLMDAGVRLPGGSDFPVEPINPFLGIYAAVTRQDASGNPDGGWQGAQRLTVEEAVRAFTVEAAYAGRMETVTGSLSPGKLADFVVISADVLSMPPVEIPRTRVLATVLGGKIVYSSKDF
jgi:predicted amidohydrolase YtcJ